jgi:hypothetical protein
MREVSIVICIDPPFREVSVDPMRARRPRDQHDLLLRCIKPGHPFPESLHIIQQEAPRLVPSGFRILIVVPIQEFCFETP